MGLLDRIDLAIDRYNSDATALAEPLKDQTVGDLNSQEQLEARRRFLAASAPKTLGSPRVFERLIAGNELQPINYLERGSIAARAIARINIRQSPGRQVAWGTGFLIAPGVLLTNHHVFPDGSMAQYSIAQFSYEAGLDDSLMIMDEFALDPDRLFLANKELDFAIVAVAEKSLTRGTPLAAFGCLPLLDVEGKASVGEWLTIIQHPNGERKQVCVRENRLIKRADDVLWYSTDTLGGSSGSPVFNNDWYVVALHHCGVPETKNGTYQTIDGRDVDDSTPEDQIKWIANEGIRASRIVQVLKASNVGNHPLLRPMFAATPATARVGVGALAMAGLKSARDEMVNYNSHTPPANAGNGDASMNGSNSVTTSVASNGYIEGNGLSVPLRATFQIDRADLLRALNGSANGVDYSTRESAPLLTEAAKKKPQSHTPKFDVPFESDYSKRSGFLPEFLGTGKHRVNLPTLSPALEKAAAKLIKAPTEYVLKYHNYSVVMHAERRFAIYSAASVDFGHRFSMSRPTDVWREDPRIDAKHQVGNFYYAGNKFDRGHLTRREDLEFGGTAMVALQSAADTCHWTNCTPQQEKFNQGKEVWQGIERYVLESAIMTNKFSAQIMTGPIFSEDDPEYKKIQYPEQYWKVVVAVNGAGELFATAYLASQKALIDEFGIEAAPLEPFGAYRNFQVKIAEVERLTGLTFTSDANTPLTSIDPLAKSDRTTRRVRRRTPVHESAAFDLPVPPGYVELTELDDIVM